MYGSTTMSGKASNSGVLWAFVDAPANQPRGLLGGARRAKQALKHSLRSSVRVFWNFNGSRLTGCLSASASQRVMAWHGMVAVHMMAWARLREPARTMDIVINAVTFYNRILFVLSVESMPTATPEEEEVPRCRDIDINQTDSSRALRLSRQSCPTHLDPCARSVRLQPL